MKAKLTTPGIIQDPPVARLLFSDTRVALIWLIVRVYVGYSWLDAGWHKIQNPAWMETGKALEGFWKRAVALPEPPAQPPIAFDWYRSFLTGLLEGGHFVWFAKVVALGETALGIALILGAFVGIAAFFGALANFNFMLAGTASTNPVLFFLAILLMLAWKTAGYWGVDRWLLASLGTPWQPIRRTREGFATS